MTIIGKYSPNEVRERVIEGTWVPEDDYAAGGGMILIKPTSISYSGSDANTYARIIDGSGSVEFNACNQVSLLGIFSSSFDNYMLVFRHHIVWNISPSMNANLLIGSTPAIASNYTYQLLQAEGTIISGFRATNTFMPIGSTAAAFSSGTITNIYGPFLAGPTVFRSVSVRGVNGANIADWAGTHSLSTSYDGLRFDAGGYADLYGLVSVYGLAGL